MIKEHIDLLNTNNLTFPFVFDCYFVAAYDFEVTSNESEFLVTIEEWLEMDADVKHIKNIIFNLLDLKDKVEIFDYYYENLSEFSHRNKTIEKTGCFIAFSLLKFCAKTMLLVGRWGR